MENYWASEPTSANRSTTSSSGTGCNPPIQYWEFKGDIYSTSTSINQTLLNKERASTRRRAAFVTSVLQFFSINDGFTALNKKILTLNRRSEFMFIIFIYWLLRLKLHSHCFWQLYWAAYDYFLYKLT